VKEIDEINKVVVEKSDGIVIRKKQIQELTSKLTDEEDGTVELILELKEEVKVLEDGRENLGKYLSFSF
jgi:uncharacterized coiled-coil protein SlyX